MQREKYTRLQDSLFQFISRYPPKIRVLISDTTIILYKPLRGPLAVVWASCGITSSHESAWRTW